MDFRGQVFGNGERVMVDGNRFFDCTFDSGCIIEFGALDRQHFENCRFHRAAQFEFDAAAARTIDYMRFFAGIDRSIVEGWIDGTNARLNF